MSTDQISHEAGHATSRRLGARTRIWLAGAAVLVLVYALVGFFIVPRFIRNQILSRSGELLHREARVDDVRFNPFTLTATVAGLRVLDRDAVELLRLERLGVNFEVSGIFRRAWRFKEIVLERPSVHARILRDGRPSVADLMESAGPSSGPSHDKFVLRRLIIDHLQLTSGVVQFTDASRQPAYESRFEPLNLDIKDLITIPQEGGEHAITIGAGTGAQLRWSGRQTVEPLRFSGRLEITNARLHPLWDYFAPEQPLEVREGRFDLVLPYDIRRGTRDPFDVNLKGASARVAGLVLRPRTGTTDWFTLPELRVTGIDVAWPAARLDVAEVTAARPRILARMDAGGGWNWQHAFTASSSSSSGMKPWTYRIAKADIEGGVARLEADATPTTASMEVADIGLHARDVTSDLAAMIPFTSRARVQEHGTLEASGHVTPSPLAFNVDFAASAIDLPALQPYISHPATARLHTGSASLKGNAVMSGAAALKVAAQGSLDDVEIRDTASGERLAAWHAMTIDGFTLDDPPNRARISTVTLDRAYARLHIDPQGHLNLTRLLALPERGSGEGSSPGTSSTSASAARRAPTLEVGTIRLRDASSDFTDDSLPPLFGTFTASIHSANGSIRDLSTFAAAPAAVDVEGRVDRTGYVKVGGTLRMSDPMASSEIAVDFRSIEMAGLSPYFAEFAGYRVKSGVLDLDVKYQVQMRRLIGNHTLVAHDLVLGERVKDSQGPGFAIRLAISLLKDREGRININVPIEGTVDSPEFSYRKVLWSAVRTIVGNAAKAPFRALGRLFGRDEDDLELVEFDPGRSDLLPADQDMLTRLGEQMVQRGSLSLSVEGRFDPKADAPAIARSKLDALVEARRPAATAAAAPGSSALETILETLFTEQFSPDALQAERRRFSTPSAPGGGAIAPPASPAAPVAPPPPSAAPAPQTAPAFDAAAFYESLRAKLLEAQQATPDDLNALASARAASIVAVLTKTPALDAARITTAASSSVKRSKKDSSRIASEMTMKAEGDD